MTSHRERSTKVRPWVYSLGLIFVGVALVFVPRLLRRSHFLYTASQFGPVEFPVIDFDRGFSRVSLKSGEKVVSLKELLAAHPGGLIVNFWATWCSPCLEELPSLEQLHRQLAAKKDPKLPWLVTLSVDERASDVQKLFKTLGFDPSFEVLFDPEGGFAGTMGTSRFPETYWVGSDGKIRYKWLGPQDWVSDAVLRRLASR